MNKFKNTNQNHKKELLELIKEWVAIPSVYDEYTISHCMPFGKNVSDALCWFENLGKDNEFIVRNVDNHAVYIEYGKGNEHIDIFGHCDVVNACEGWDSNPFELKIDGDKLIGRGISDNKGPMIACFLALKMIRDLDIKLNRKVRLIVGGNEESGFKCIKHYYSKEPYGVCGFTPDAKFPVLNGEKGSGNINLRLNIENKDLILRGGLENNTIPSKATIINLKENKKYIVKGVGGHSSKPQDSVNPIPKALINLYEELGEKWIIDLYKLINEENVNGKLFGLDIEGKCGILSIVPTIINVENGCVEVTLNTRYPENIKFEDIIKIIRTYIHQNNMAKFNVTGKEIKKSNYIDEKSELVKILHNIYVKHSKDTKSVVRVTSAGSYASEMNNSVIYGCEFPDGGFGNIHKENEFASLEKLNLAITIYAEAIVCLCNSI